MTIKNKLLAVLILLGVLPWTESSQIDAAPMIKKRKKQKTKKMRNVKKKKARKNKKNKIGQSNIMRKNGNTFKKKGELTRGEVKLEQNQNMGTTVDIGSNHKPTNDGEKSGALIEVGKEKSCKNVDGGQLDEASKIEDRDRGGEYRADRPVSIGLAKPAPLVFLGAAKTTADGLAEDRSAHMVEDGRHELKDDLSNYLNFTKMCQKIKDNIGSLIRVKSKDGLKKIAKKGWTKGGGETEEKAEIGGYWSNDMGELKLTLGRMFWFESAQSDKRRKFVQYVQIDFNQQKAVLKIKKDREHMKKSLFDIIKTLARVFTEKDMGDMEGKSVGELIGLTEEKASSNGENFDQRSRAGNEEELIEVELDQHEAAEKENEIRFFFKKTNIDKFEEYVEGALDLINEINVEEKEGQSKRERWRKDMMEKIKNFKRGVEKKEGEQRSQFNPNKRRTTNLDMIDLEEVSVRLNDGKVTEFREELKESVRIDRLFIAEVEGKMLDRLMKGMDLYGKQNKLVNKMKKISNRVKGAINEFKIDNIKKEEEKTSKAEVGDLDGIHFKQFDYNLYDIALSKIEFMRNFVEEWRKQIRDKEYVDWDACVSYAKAEVTKRVTKRREMEKEFMEE